MLSLKDDRLRPYDALCPLFKVNKMRLHRILILTAAALCFLATSPARADSGIRRTPCGYQQLSSTQLATAQKLTVPTTICPQVTAIVFSVSGASVRYRDDGTAPTTSTGVSYPVSTVPYLYEGSIANIQFIGTGATLDVLFYK
jgi:hypothetical protein